MSSGKNLIHVASRVLNTPLLITPAKFDAILQFLGPRIGLEISEPVAAADFSKSMNRRSDSEDGIGVIPIHGTLVHRSSGFDGYSGLTSYEAIRTQFREALNDRSVEAILLDIDSPGGEVAGVFDLVDEIYAARGIKPIYAVANESAFSAAYAIASATDRVFLPRTGGMGSIGVLYVHADRSGFNEKTGFKYTPIFAGARKNDFSPNDPLSDEARVIAQSQLDEIYDVFVRTVARNRGLSKARVRGTDAAMFQGDGAVSQGLADEVRSFAEIFEMIQPKKKGGRAMAEAPKSPSIVAGGSDAALDASGNATMQNVEQIRAEAESRGKEAEQARVVGIMEACAAVQHLIPKELSAELIKDGISIEAARERIIRAIADGSGKGEIVNTTGALARGTDDDVLIKDALRRAGKQGGTHGIAN
jgi:capsid assembly protease